MKAPAPAPVKRGVFPILIAIAACGLCLGVGWITGRMYLEGQEIAASAVAPAATTTSGPVGSTAPALAVPRRVKAGKPGRAIYAPGTTVYKGLDSRKGAKPVCLNTCSKARNGVCNDGRPKLGETDTGAKREVLCDLGTDCEDCGPWTPSGDAPWASGKTPGPVGRLVAKGIQVNVKRVVTDPTFLFAYTDPNLDVDVSSHVDGQGGVEMGISHLFFNIFKKGCTPDGPEGKKRGLFLDVGSNFGWFAVQAATLGCRVIAFEPVPHFHAFLEYSVHLNGFAHLVDMRGNVVSHESGKTMEMFAPNRGIWGTAGIGGLNIDKAIKGNQNEVHHVESQTIDELVNEPVLLMKVDVEGWEWSVMQGAHRLLTQRLAQNIIMEYSPGVPERHFKFKEMRATVQMLVNMVDAGHSIAHLGDTTKHHQGGWHDPVRPYQQITRANLMYDLLDVELFTMSKLGCPIPASMNKYEMWGMCNCLPEDVNPRSLRSVIGHNTNIWASLAKDRMKLTVPVGVVKPDAPPNTYFVSAGSEFGSGSRPCAHLPEKVQVRHRCPCVNKTACGAEEKLAQEAAIAGLHASSYTLTADGKMVMASGAPAELLGKIGSAEAIGFPYRSGAVKGPLSTTNKPLNPDR